MFNAVYTAYLLTGEERYRKAVTDGIEGVTRKPEYLFDETGAGRKWGANAYSDSLEGALVLLNRLPNSAAEAQVDLATRKFFDRQQADGIIEDWHGDGNFVRTALMYAFWKTQGAYVEPWSRRVHVGAAPESAGVLIHLSAESPWQGRLRFDHPRHRDHWNMAVNCPRLNEFPEWFTVEQDRPYLVRIGDGPARKYLGADLVSGIPLALNGGETIVIRVAEAGNPPYGRSP